MRAHQKTVFRLLTTAILLLVPQILFAAAGAQAFVEFVNEHIITQAVDAFEAVAAVALVFYGVMLIMNASKDSSYTDAINSFINAAIGFVILAISGAFVNAFYLNTNPSVLIPGVNSITDYLVTAASALFVLMLTLLGIQMLSTQGDSGEFGKLRGMLVSNMVGLGMTMFAKVIVLSVAGNAPDILVVEMAGLATFLLTIMGTVCVAAIVAAGAYLIISVDQSYKDRAQKTIIGTLLVLGVVLSSYALIVAFV